MIKSLTMLALIAGVADAAAPAPGPERAGAAVEPVRVVTTLPVYAVLAREVGGNEVVVTAIADPNEDAHFVRPKPSFAAELRRADLFVTTGLDLELWVPTLLDKAGNARVAQGGRGYVTAYTGVDLLDIPATADRSAGDTHIYGNPHIYTDPLRALQVARNITVGLKRVAPDRAAVFDRGLAGLTDRMHRSLFGDALVDLLRGETLEDLARKGALFSFLADNEYEGAPLLTRLGGWLKEAEAFRGQSLICYHKNWAYFEDRFSVRCVDYVEPKPGISPTPRHVAQLIELMQDRKIRVLLAASYFDRSKVEAVARRGGAIPVIVPLEPGARPEAADYFSMVDFWMSSLAGAFRELAERS